MTNGRGPDVCVDAVGMEVDRTPFEKAANLLHGQAGSISVLEAAIRAVRRCGVVSVVGVYGTAYDNFPWHRLFDKSVRIHGGQSDPQARMDALKLRPKKQGDDA